MPFVGATDVYVEEKKYYGFNKFSLKKSQLILVAFL